MRFISTICFEISKRLILKRQTGDAGENPATFDKNTYQKWREDELTQQFTDHFSPSEIIDMDVLDFGCGDGELSFLMAKLGAKSVIGVELASERYSAAVKKLETKHFPVQPHFILASDTIKLELTDNSMDVILCFDVLEHVMEYDLIIREWYRVLRPGGKILIWWVPWWHPYGPHIESLIPIPWCHLFFSEKTLLNTCARIYDMPEFKPRIWDIDANGKKKPNKWLDMKTLPEVNKLTMGDFERLAQLVGFAIQRKTPRGFGSSRLAKLTHIFLYLPILKEFFTSSVTYCLQKSVR